MLDFIYYPVSWILWVWHKVFGSFLGADNGFAWALSVMFLVFTLRAILYYPFVKQVRTTRQMQELQPQIKALQKKYANDRQRMATEMQKLQKEHGFNPLMGCLPVLLQAPVFIGLFHVLRSFNRTGNGFGQIGMTIEQNANTPNYVFSASEVQSFLDARLFGAPIAAAITTPKSQLIAYGLPIPTVLNIAAVAVPLMLIASIATHFNSRASVARQSEAAAANPQAAIMNKLSLWIFPLGVLVGGPFLMIAILLYWVSNNIWTYAQQHIVFRRIDAEEEEKKAKALERRAENAPKPGAKPVKRKGAAQAAADSSSDPDAASVQDESSAAGSSTTAESSGPGQKPKPGARPAGNRGKNTKRKR
ncbi:membrane protein insertase YidC [Rhodococcus sp. NPDC003318]|uniref:membrane protein insertase YidC n=1 Tax=Rhodococcus sp. NPDC003318 TaxID=3364503 RepID=UPI00369A6925